MTTSMPSGDGTVTDAPSQSALDDDAAPTTSLDPDAPAADDAARDAPTPDGPAADDPAPDAPASNAPDGRTVLDGPALENREMHLATEDLRSSEDKTASAREIVSDLARKTQPGKA